MPRLNTSQTFLQTIVAKARAGVKGTGTALTATILHGDARVLNAKLEILWEKRPLCPTDSAVCAERGRRGLSRT